MARPSATGWTNARPISGNAALSINISGISSETPHYAGGSDYQQGFRIEGDRVNGQKREGELVDNTRFGYRIVREGEVENGEYKIGLRSVSAPVYTVEGKAAYAVGVIGMFRSPHSEEFRAAVEQVCVTASMISTALGYRKQEETL